MNDFFKKFIICVCIVGFLFSPLRPQRASAIAVVDDCIIIGGVLIATSVVVSLMIKSGNYDGYEVNDDYSIDLKSYLTKKILALSSAEIAEYFFTAKDDSGKDYVGVTDSGTTYSREELKSLFNIEVNNFPVSTTKTTTNVTPVSKEPYMLNGFYMQSYDYGAGKTYISFSVPKGTRVKFQFANSTGSFVRTVSYATSTSDPVYYRVYQDTKSTVDAFFANRLYSDNSGWNGLCFNEDLKFGFSFSSGNVFIGVQSASDTVYVPGNKVISQNTPIDKPADSVVAAPISGQYSNDGSTIVYNGIDGGVANAVSGLKAADLSTTTPIDGNTGTGTDAGFWSTLWGWLEKIYKGIISIPGAIEALPGEIATSFENALQYVFVPTANDFSDFYNDIEGDVKLKFPYSVSILNSLEVNADEFKDIHVTLWGHDCIIVSAQFVNNNISWIRVVTSCFWIFSLFVYVWRKINSVLNGGDVNSTTVYAPGGGGSGPPSVI